MKARWFRLVAGIFVAPESSTGHELYQIRLKSLRDLRGSDDFATIEAVEDLLDDLLGLVSFSMQEEAVEDMLTAHRVGDLGFLVVLAELGEVHHPVAAAEIGLAVDFKHQIFGIGTKGHSA